MIHLYLFKMIFLQYEARGINSNNITVNMQQDNDFDELCER